MKIAKVKPEFSPEVIEALAKLREHVRYYSDIRGSFDLLDNAGVFAAIDAAAKPERLLKGGSTRRGDANRNRKEGP